MNKKTPPSPIKFFKNLEKEHDFIEVSVTGEIPSSLNGILYRSGVGIFKQFGKRYKHTFEGDGAISAIKFEDSKAYISSKVIQSEGLLEEINKGKNIYGSKAPWYSRFINGLKNKRKNTANTHIVALQKGLYALMEGAKPTQIDFETLATIGEEDFNGEIKGTFSAHPHYVTSRECLYNFGLEYGKETKLNFYELPNRGKVRRIGGVTLEKPVMLHDFIVSDNYLIFFIAPAQLKIWKLLLSIGSFIDCLKWDEKSQTEIIVVPIDDCNKTYRFKTKAFFASHFAGAFEENGKIYVDYIHYPDIKLFENLGDGSELNWRESDNHSHGKLHRAEIEIKNNTFKSNLRWNGHCEFPRIAKKFSGKKYPDIWLQSEEYIDGFFRSSISRINERNEVVTFVCDEGHLCSEPVPITSEANGDSCGYVLSLVFDSYKNISYYLLLTARDLKFQARIELSQAIPITFHGSWVNIADSRSHFGERFYSG